MKTFKTRVECRKQLHLYAGFLFRIRMEENGEHKLLADRNQTWWVKK